MDPEILRNQNLEGVIVDNMVPEEWDEGNSNLHPIPLKVKRISPAKNWCFTLNNYTDEEFLQILYLSKKPEINRMIAAEEVGENGTPHIQGFCEFHSKLRPLSLNLTDRIHWIKAKGNVKQNKDYCMKENKVFVCVNMLSNGEIRDMRIKKLLITKLRPWQQKIVNVITDDPDNRKIYWYYDENGGIGKTSLCKYLCYHYGCILVDGHKKDILYTASNYYDACENGDIKMPKNDVFIFDFSRTVEYDISYESLEKLKNGLFMNEKYESKMVNVDIPHIIVFANFRPKESALSKDRWCIVNLSKII